MQIKKKLTFEFFQDGSDVIAVCPTLNICTYGDDLEDAKRSAEELLDSWFESVLSRDVLEETLISLGWKEKTKGRLDPPEPITVEEIPVPTFS